jgi:hypothetical protein
MKFLKFILISSLAASSFAAPMAALSTKSKERVAVSAIKGGLNGLCLAGLAAFIHHITDQTGDSKVDLKAWGLFGGLAAVFGAAAGGISEYFWLSETRFASIKEDLSRISQDPFIGMLYQTKSEDWISKIKEYFARSRFPMREAFNNLREHYDKIVQANHVLNDILTSDVKYSKQEVQELLTYADTTLTLIKGVLSKITSEPNFMNESAVKAQEDAAHLLAQAAITQQIILASELARRSQTK